MIQLFFESRALRSEVQLTPDQALGLCELIEFNQNETEYFLLLVNQERAATKKLRQHLEKKSKKLREEYLDLSNRIQSTIVQSDQREIVYYSAWFWSAIYVIVSIPQFRTVSAIAQRLSLPVFLVQQVLSQYESLGLFRKNGQEYSLTDKSLHLSKHSPLISNHHNNWRQRAVYDSQVNKTESLHYTVVQTMTRKTFEDIREEILKLIDKSAKLADPSKEEEVFCLNIDWFQA